MAARTSVLLAMLLWILFAAVQSAEWEDIHYDPSECRQPQLTAPLKASISIRRPSW